MDTGSVSSSSSVKKHKLKVKPSSTNTLVPIPPPMTDPSPQPVLELVAPPECVNLDFLKQAVHDYLAPRMAYIRRFRKQANLAIEDDFSEWWMADATKGRWIGGGSCPMDAISNTAEGFDAMCVCVNSTTTNEKSIIQNFSKSGDALDTYFKENKHQEALDLFRKDLQAKWGSVETEKGLCSMYYACFISNTQSVYLAIFKIHVGALATIESDGFRGKGTSNKTIRVKHFIPADHGQVVLYKSKKRMELRLMRDLVKNVHVKELYRLPSILEALPAVQQSAEPQEQTLHSLPACTDSCQIETASYTSEESLES